MGNTYRQPIHQWITNEFRYKIVGYQPGIRYHIKYPTPDKVKIRQMEAISRFPEGAWYPDVVKICFPGKGPGQNIDTFKTLLSDEFVVFSGKLRNRKLYKLTEDGKKLLEYAMQYKKVNDLIEMLGKAESYPEFKMNIIFEAKADLLQEDFIKSSILPILNGTFLNSCQYQEVDHAKVVKHMQGKLKNAKFWNEYFEDMKKIVSIP